MKCEPPRAKVLRTSGRKAGGDISSRAVAAQEYFSGGPAIPDEDVYLLTPEEIMPDDFGQPAPDDAFAHGHRFWNRRTIFTPAETEYLTAVLIGWRDGKFDTVTAMGALNEHDLIDYDTMLQLYLDYTLARAKMEET